MFAIPVATTTRGLPASRSAEWLSASLLPMLSGNQTAGYPRSSYVAAAACSMAAGCVCRAKLQTPTGPSAARRAVRRSVMRAL